MIDRYVNQSETRIGILGRSMKKGVSQSSVMQEKMESSEEIQPNEKWVPLDLSKLPHLLEIGWHAFEMCPITSDKEFFAELTRMRESE